MVRASGCQCQSKAQQSWVRSSVLRHDGNWGAADEAVLNNGHSKIPQKSPFILQKTLDHLQIQIYILAGVFGSLLLLLILGLLYLVLLLKRYGWGTQRDVVYLDWHAITPSYMSSNAGGRVCGLSQWVKLCTWGPNKLWRSNFIDQKTIKIPNPKRRLTRNKCEHENHLEKGLEKRGGSSAHPRIREG